MFVKSSGSYSSQLVRPMKSQSRESSDFRFRIHRTIVAGEIGFKAAIATWVKHPLWVDD